MFHNKRIKHFNNHDVSFIVQKEYYVKEKDIYKLKGHWYNDLYKFIYDVTDKIQIKGIDVKNWKVIE